MARIQRILCPVDFFPASEQAVDFAISLAKSQNASLILMHVVSPVLHTAYELPLNTAEIIGSMTQESERHLKRLAKRAERVRVPVDTVVRTGDVDLEITAMADKHKADLIVMGTHGRRGVEQWFMGSVTERLLRRMPVPLLTVSQKKRMTTRSLAPRRILVTTDFSDGTREAIAYALSIAPRSGCEVTLLHVITDANIEIAPRYRDSLINGIRIELERLIPAGSEFCNVETRVESGTPYMKILNILSRENFDLLVMNIHGKGMLDRALLGSTAERVVRGAPTPVLLIPPVKAARRAKKAAKAAA